MKKLLCTTAALAALTLSIPAQAAIFDGAYLGLQLGHNNTKIDSQDNNFLMAGNTSNDFGASGLELGLVGGYRMKQDRFVFGVEVDGSLSDAKSTLMNFDDGLGNTAQLELEKRYSYAIGPRVGFLVTENTLAFVGADWTRGNFKASATVNGVAASDTESLNGFRLGGGLEVAATEAVSVRLDYQHTQ